MRFWGVAGGLALAAVVAGTAVAQGVAQTEVITARRDGLKRMSQHMEAIKAATEARSDPQALVARAEDMQAWFQALPTRFPAGTDTPPGTGPGQTRALPVIWTERAGFERAAANAAAAAGVLRTAAASGDAAATAKAFQELGSTCGACHRTYRAR
jgi:cytochrome c556